MAAPVLQFKRGAFSNLPGLRAGEPGFTTDKYDLYVGLSSEVATNKFIGSARFWNVETASSGSAVNLVESSSGTNYISLASPASLAGIVTYYFPGTQGAVSSVLTNDGSGNLSWASGSADPVFTGIATFNTSWVDINSDVDISGITTVTNTTDNTLGDANTGAFQIDGGLGVNKNVTIGGNLNVQGYSEFVGVVTFKGGTINLGDANTDDINVAGEFISSLVPNDDNSYDVGGDASKQWRHANFAGIGTFDGGLDIGGEATFASATVEDLTSGRVVLAGTSGALEDSADLTFSGNGLTVGAGGINVTGVSTFSTDVFVGGGLNVTGVATFTTSNVYIDQQLYVGGLQVNGGADISGQVTLNNDLSVTGVSTFTGAIDANGGADISGQVTLNNDLSVTGVSTFTGAIDANGGANISGGETVLSSATVSDLTAGRVVLAGTSGALEDSGDLTFGSNILTVINTIDVTTLEATNLKAKDGTTAITISDVSGNVSCASSLTVSGDLVVLGSQTQVNTETLKVEDSLIEIGLINSGGSLVEPTSDLNIDVGVIFHYHNGSAAKKAAVYWDDSVGRVVVGDDVSESTSVMTASTYAGFEIGSLWVNDCAGQSQVINCSGSTRTLENITIDGGSF